MNNEAIASEDVLVKINGDITIPPSYRGETHFIIPDDIVKYCAHRYDLLNRTPVLDPMCGIGSIPRVLNSLGGDCTGIEIDADRSSIALSMNVEHKVFHDDFMSANLPKHHFQCIFTSMPFDWFEHEDTVESSYGEKFHHLLAPGGFVLLDSVPVVLRRGHEWPVASRQCAYLEACGFELTETVRFVANNNASSAFESVIMRFQACA